MALADVCAAAGDAVDAAERRQREADEGVEELRKDNDRLRATLDEMGRRLDRSLRRELMFRGVENGEEDTTTAEGGADAAE